jgi:cytochrome c-type biogenesis protein CcmH
VTLLALVLLAVAALAPLAVALRWRVSARTRRDSALAIHRLQLQELDRDLAEGRIGAGEHATALLEVQRRLLAVAESAEPASARESRLPLLATLVLVPLLAAGLYAIDAHPFMPAAPLAARMSAADHDAVQAELMIGRLRDKLATMDQTSDLARQGYIILGNAEDSRGHLAEAAVAWRRAVAVRFDADLAALAAEAQTRVEGHVSPDSAALFRRALAAAPTSALWRPTAEQRLVEASKQ